MAIVIYSKATGRVRRIISNSAGESQTNIELRVRHPDFTGERTLSAANNLSLEEYQNLVTIKSGKIPANDRYVVVAGNGDVVNAIIADPKAGDSIENHSLVAHNTATIGWRRMRNGSFQRSLKEIDYDIATQTRSTTAVFSPKSFRTQTESDSLTIQNKLDAEAALLVLNAERNARVLVR